MIVLQDMKSNHLPSLNVMNLPNQSFFDHILLPQSIFFTSPNENSQ